jgi:CTP:phosphocholine cytidylyltransferase-like protein
MKAVILAGGFGSRISEESHLKPKPLIEIGGQPKYREKNHEPVHCNTIYSMLNKNSLD